MRKSAFFVALALIPSLCVGQSREGLWDAIVAGDTAAVTRYLEAGGDPNTPIQAPAGEMWPLLKAALFDHEQAMALALLQAEAEFELADVDLSTVVAEGLTDVLKFLLFQRPGRFTDAFGQDPRRLLMPAATRGYSDMLSVLLGEAKRQGLAWPPDLMREALGAAIGFRQNDLARLLLAYGAVPTSTTLYVASRDGSPGMVHTLLQQYDVDPRSRLDESRVDPEIGARTAMEYAWHRYDHAGNEHDREAARLILIELTEAGASDESVESGSPLHAEDLLQSRPVAFCQAASRCRIRVCR